MPSKQLPASIRSLKVRLRILQRPSVWVSATVLLGAIVLLAETWKHPEWFATDNQSLDNQPSDRQPSANSANTDSPTRSNPAPLDPFSSVDRPQFGTVEDAEDPLSSLPSRGLPDSSQTDRLDLPLLLPPSRLPTTRSSSSPSVPDPFASIRVRSTPETSNGSGGGARGASSFGSGLSNGSQLDGSQNPFSSSHPSSGNQSNDQSPNSVGTNPLESAIDRHNSPALPQSGTFPQSNLSSPNANPTGVTASPELPTPTAPGVGQSTFVQPQPIPGQPSYGQTQPQPQFLPQTAPAPGTTGYTPPPAFRTNANTPTGSSFGNYNTYNNQNNYNQNNYSPSGVPSTVSPSTVSPSTVSPSTVSPSTPQSGGFSPTVQPQFQPSPSQPTPAPFSVPRAAPGQSIGGGRINSFSNP